MLPLSSDRGNEEQMWERRNILLNWLWWNGYEEKYNGSGKEIYQRIPFYFFLEEGEILMWHLYKIGFVYIPRTYVINEIEPGIQYTSIFAFDVKDAKERFYRAFYHYSSSKGGYQIKSIEDAGVIYSS